MNKIVKELYRVPRNIGKIVDYFVFKYYNPSAIIFNKKYIVTSGIYSMMGEDSIVKNTFFKNVNDGVFCDVGGYHPVEINDTYAFEKSGWTGYAFEPLPSMASLWREKRTADFYPYAVSSENKMIQFSVCRGDAEWVRSLSNAFGNDIHNVGYKGYEYENIDVQCIVLGDFFKERAVKKINYMSVAVEGSELEVLKGIDFEFTKIDILTVQNNIGKNSIYGNIEIQKYMIDNGFILHARTLRLKDFYVRKDFINHKKLEG